MSTPEGIPVSALVPLGKSGLSVSPLAAGSWEWGRVDPGGLRPDYAEADLAAAFRASVEAGVTFFDTAEVYWQGRSEELLGSLVRGCGAAVTVASKFAPHRSRFLPFHLAAALRRSLSRLGLETLDLYQTHWHTPPVPLRIWMSALERAWSEGLIRAAGVSNYTREMILRAGDLLSRRGMPLASVQNQYSLLHRAPERDGVLDACRAGGVAFLAWSPLGNGLFGGRYGPDAVPAVIRQRRFGEEERSALRRLYAMMLEIGSGHGGKTIPQVALNWLMARGVIPIHGAKTAAQARENAGALGWRLDGAEMQALTDASDRLAAAHEREIVTPQTKG